jgi:hypothetical protein
VERGSADISVRAPNPFFSLLCRLGSRILGVLSLDKKFGTAAVDEACAAALKMGVQEYRFVRRYLERCP